MPNSPRIEAALDLACLMHKLLQKPSRCTAEERREIRVFVTRAIAALGGHDLPAGDGIDNETAHAAFQTFHKALTLKGIDNHVIVDWFNESALDRLTSQAVR